MARLWHGNRADEPGVRGPCPPDRRPPLRAASSRSAWWRRSASAPARPARRARPPVPRPRRRPPRRRRRPADRAASPVSADTIEHPTGAGDIVLRAATRGGFMRLETVMSRLPEFTLYGDGRALILPPGDEPSGGGGGLNPGAAGNGPVTVPTLREVRLSEAEVQALLKFALVDGRLGTARDAYMGGNMDAPSTVFELQRRRRGPLDPRHRPDRRPGAGPGCRGAAGVLRPGRPAAVDRHRRGLHVRPDDGGDHRDLGRARRDRPAVAVDRPRARRLPPAAGRRREPVPLAPADRGTGHRGRRPDRRRLRRSSASRVPTAASTRSCSGRPCPRSCAAG